MAKFKLTVRIDGPASIEDDLRIGLSDVLADIELSPWPGDAEVKVRSSKLERLP